MDLEKYCPKYNRELYKHFKIFIKPQGRLNFPKNTPPVDFVFTKDKNYSHTQVFDNQFQEPPATETRFNYKIPNSSMIKDKDGARKMLLEKFLWAQMGKEVIGELVDKNQVENYCSEYESHYYKDDFTPFDWQRVKNENDHIKYPIYGTGSNAITYYSYKKHNAKNILNPFKRSYNITRPVNERTTNDL